MDSSNQTSRVFLRDLKVEARIGYYAQEKSTTQPLVVTIELTLGVKAFKDDDLGGTVDYTPLAHHGRALAASHIDLIETFAERLSERCLTRDGVMAVLIRVEKPRAVPDGMAGVEIIRVRSPA